MRQGDKLTPDEKTVREAKFQSDADQPKGHRRRVGMPTGPEPTTQKIKDAFTNIKNTVFGK